MKIFTVQFVISFVILFAQNNRVLSNKNVSTIDLLIQSIQKENWEKHENACFNQILRTLQNAKNSTLWATWVLDSIQFLPSGVLYGSKYQLGNYDECMKPPWLHERPEFRTKYCLADIRLTDDSSLRREAIVDPDGNVETYINTLTKHGRALNTLTWGVCVPAACSARAVSALLSRLLRAGSWAALRPRSVSAGDCQLAGDTPVYGAGVYIFWYLLLSLLAIAVISTWYIDSSHNKSRPDTLTIKLAKAFDMNANAYDLVKPSAEDMPILHGMRAMTALIFVYTHQVFFLNSGAVINGLDVDKDLDMGFFVLHTDLFTDTFLFMSGLLLAKGLAFKEKLENPIMVLLKRYIRLIGPMALIVFYMASVSTYASDGPLWHRLAGHEQKTCEKNWWLSLLMLNNYVNSKEMCFIILWYIPADFHLTILGVALIYLCRRHRLLGRMAVTLVALLAIILPGLKTYWSELPATIIYNVETMIDIRSNKVFNSTYIRSHYRMGSYLVGLAFGYLLTVYKITQYRNTISKSWSILIFVLAFMVAWIPMSLGGVFYTRPYSAVEAALYSSTNRIGQDKYYITH